MKNDILCSRRRVVAENLKRPIRCNGSIKTVENFARLHGSDIRTVKRWRKDGIDSLDKIAEVSTTLGISFFELIMTEEEFDAYKEQRKKQA